MPRVNKLIRKLNVIEGCFRTITHYIYSKRYILALERIEDMKDDLDDAWDMAWDRLTLKERCEYPDVMREDENSDA